MPVVVSISCDQYCAQFAEGVLQRYGRVDHAVSCFGGFWEGGEIAAGREGRAAGAGGRERGRQAGRQAVKGSNRGHLQDQSAVFGARPAPYVQPKAGRSAVVN